MYFLMHRKIVTDQNISGILERKITEEKNRLCKTTLSTESIYSGQQQTYVLRLIQLSVSNASKLLPSQVFKTAIP